MSIKAALYHRTAYTFDRPVNLSPHIIRLRPAVHSRTPIEAYTLKVEPENHFLNWQQDPYGNYLARLVFPEKTTSLKIEVELIADLSVINPFDFFLEEYAQEFPFSYPERLKKALEPYLEITELGPLLNSLLAEIDTSTQATIDFLVQVNQLVNSRLDYNLRMESGVQTCEETLGIGRGSCRDFSWLMVQVFRHLGLAARFVSGYSVQLKPDEKPLEGPAGVSEDVTDLHAWVEVYIPGAGWIGLDATSGLFCTEGHIPLACVPDFEMAAPIEGATDICEVTFDFENTVRRIEEDPRVTKPYREDQWTEILNLGEKVDAVLQTQDVRLTMGGEPTFVSIDDMEADQWNTKADGNHKRALAWDLATRLRDNFGPGGILHYAQGKWYAGEPLPRWAYSIIWRKDGQPIWKNPDLLANPNKEQTIHTGTAELFLKTLAENLGISPDNTQAAYEDIFYMLWEEGQVPIDEDPLKADLDDPLERRNLAAVLDRGLDAPLGYVIPLAWDFEQQDWQSCPWTFRRKYLFLTPGNSPIGLRLPLNSLPATVEVPIQRSLFEEVGDFAIRSNEAIGQTKVHKERKEVPRTAVCAEVRSGNLYVFLPPLSYAEHALELLQVIEKTTEDLGISIILEGYAPPLDNRMEKMSVTPDPGVIEVNIHPAGSWSEMVERIDTLYELAKQSRLGAEKFMVDGRHTGTGGGNHITLGAARPADSPFLRRPDLLQSMVTYWQHHPSLSYLFSGAFIGPTSQAPRIDEGLEDRLYEMELAFTQVPKPGEQNVPYWLVDRIFRHLLTDITGNTHRAEFCIDKLYSPDSPSGRLGLLEMRSLDMPPHRQMSLVQMLLIRSLVSWFWKQPYEHGLVRWGTQLYDKYLLPHFNHQDMAEVVSDLQGAGYPFQLQWLDPFFEFRFPRYGSVQVKDIQLEVRMAIEPWHVLGEEMSNLGTARFVDSSLERVQVKLTGLNDARYKLLCNGCEVPLVATGTQGQFVAGIRYRAWQPPSALHPTIGIDAPLVFDLVDTWKDQTVGGCTYHVSHPGGRSYDVFPVNAYEAESRRINRFRNTDYTPGPVEYTPSRNRMVYFDEQAPYHKESISYRTLAANPDFPYTLDLRWAKK
jgi:uncharacterized protein (DUF2126 family)